MPEIQRARVLCSLRERANAGLPPFFERLNIWREYSMVCGDTNGIVDEQIEKNSTLQCERVFVAAMSGSALQPASNGCPGHAASPRQARTTEMWSISGLSVFISPVAYASRHLAPAQPCIVMQLPMKAHLFRGIQRLPKVATLSKETTLPYLIDGTAQAECGCSCCCHSKCAVMWSTELSNYKLHSTSFADFPSVTSQRPQPPSCPPPFPRPRQAARLVLPLPELLQAPALFGSPRAPRRTASGTCALRHGASASGKGSATAAPPRRPHLSRPAR